MNDLMNRSEALHDEYNESIALADEEEEAAAAVEESEPGSNAAEADVEEEGIFSCPLLTTRGVFIAVEDESSESKTAAAEGMP